MKAPAGLHEALDRLVTRMAEENRTYGQARVMWVGEAGTPDFLTLLTLDLNPPDAPAIPTDGPVRSR